MDGLKCLCLTLALFYSPIEEIGHILHVIMKRATLWDKIGEIAMALDVINEKKHVFAFIAFLCLGFHGCATTSNYESIVKSWIGVPSKWLLADWGSPYSTFHNSDGSSVLTYRDIMTRTGGGYPLLLPKTTYYKGNISSVTSSSGLYSTQYYTTGQYSGQATTYEYYITPTYIYMDECTTTFSVSPDGIIKSYSFYGSGCLAFNDKMSTSGRKRNYNVFVYQESSNESRAIRNTSAVQLNPSRAQESPWLKKWKNAFKWEE